MSLNDFYNKITNIKVSDDIEEFKSIVVDEKQKLDSYSFSTDGLCKFIANQILFRLGEIPGINCQIIDLNNYSKIDHVSLLVQINTSNSLKRFIVDPTYDQFVKAPGKELINLSIWPGDKIKDKAIIDGLSYSGFIEIDNIIFNDYMNSFNDVKVVYDLDEFCISNSLINKKL